MQPAGRPLLEADADADRALRLVGFAARLRGLHMRRAALHGALGAALLVGGPAIVAVWLVPSRWWVGVGAGVGIALLAAAIAGFRARRVANAALLRGGDGELEQLGVVGDELATWLEWQPRHTSPAMVAWLARAVDAQLPQLSPGELQAVGRRPLGRLRHLVPVIALLLLAVLLLEWFQPPWPGVLGGKPEPRPVASRGGGSGPGAAGATDSPQAPPAEPGPGEQPPREQAPPPPPTADDAPEPQPAPPPEPPAPLLEVPGQQHFVLPEHIDDGPTRRMRMHAAELPEPLPAPGSAPPPAAAPRGAEALPVPPPAAAEQFQRAAEQAERARNVPPAEQAMVRRFFDLLQKAAR